LNALTLRPRHSHRRRARVLAAAVPAAAAAVAVVIARHRRRGSAEGRRSWDCGCGQGYLISGSDRHRVYWLPGAAQSDPLLMRACVSCGATLPARHDAALN
jgi:hypothetical protein